MELRKLLSRRYSCRTYKDKLVSDQTILQILNNAILAPNAGNLQLWKFMVVKNEDKREEIAIACLQQKWMIQAPVHIVIAADLDVMKKNYGEKAEMYCIQDCSLAASYIMLIAADLGLDTCFVSAFDTDMLKRAVEFPENIVPYVVITLGYSNETPEDKKRYNIRAFTFFETYSSLLEPYSSRRQDKSMFPVMTKAQEKMEQKNKSLMKKIKEKLVKHPK